MLGSYEVEVNGERLVLALSMNAMCAAEQESGKSFSQILTAMNGGEFGSIRLLFWAVLRKAKPGLTMDDAGEMIDQMGLTTVIKSLTRVIENSGLIEKDANAKNPPARRTKAG